MSGSGVAIDEEHAGGGDAVARDFFDGVGKALVALGEDGAFAIALVDEDVGGLAVAIGDSDEVGFNTCSFERGGLHLAGRVVAYFAEVAGAQAPALAGDDGGGDLSAE